jgi:hypothetical protein
MLVFVLGVMDKLNLKRKMKLDFVYIMVMKQHTLFVVTCINQMKNSDSAGNN